MREGGTGEAEEPRRAHKGVKEALKPRVGAGKKELLVVTQQEIQPRTQWSVPKPSLGPPNSKPKPGTSNSNQNETH